MAVRSSKSRPTADKIAKAITKLLHDLAIVYAGDCEYTRSKTNEHGTISVTWKSGHDVLEEKR